jgi:hypothetical protein
MYIYNCRTYFAELQLKMAQGDGGHFEDDVKKHLNKFLDTFKQKYEHISETDSTTNTSSSTSNRTFTIMKKSLKLPSMRVDSTSDNSPPTKVEHSDKHMGIQSPSIREEKKRKESLKVKAPSSIKRGDVSFRGLRKSGSKGAKDVVNETENERQNIEDSNFAGNSLQLSPESPSATESVYTTTLTSNNTMADQFSDWTSKSDTLCRESCDSGSEWWNENRGYYEDEEEDLDDEHNRVRLNVDNEDLSDDMLRQHRLNQHLKSVEKINCHRNDVIETVVTASGRQLGRSNPSKVPKPAPRLSLNKESTKQKNDSKKMTSIFNKIRNKSKVKLFSVEDVVSSREITESEFMESYDRSRDGATNDLKWDEVSLTVSIQ